MKLEQHLWVSYCIPGKLNLCSGRAAACDLMQPLGRMSASERCGKEMSSRVLVGSHRVHAFVLVDLLCVPVRMCVRICTGRIVSIQACSFV